MVSPASGPNLARPKSAIQSLPAASISRLPGLTSRWTMPTEWAYSSASAASAIRAAMRRKEFVYPGRTAEPEDSRS